AEPRKIEVIEPFHDFLLVLRKVDFDARLHVKGFECDPIFLLQRGEKSGGPGLADIGKKPAIASAAELQQEDQSNGSVGGREVGDGLRHAFVKDAEVFL